ncbi:threonine/homoserine/homoserine lactone efflux protein [Actinoalloteichus hoggarensis]|uniref:Uncharacterized protein n=1 Tax=Actinoalloteichus hoggarensis TaxID=1470176 RepID=A0A221W0W5_9PSEU|nr:DUF3040 domain-containing protein [Actinoalloteichus hoggarensis]ASO19435.1 hypothetical protein AHOG_08955 [Actinoalloteichus hoggarensis]MBB5919861.1 threonine/homoserine/homoserine lactone efflux protein [Actinoalloteichus hoggarensis]
MPLSEHEQRLLDQIERALYAEDPKFASSVRGARLRKPARRRRLQGITLLVVGLVMLVLGVVLPVRVADIPIISVLGFLLMFGGVALMLMALRSTPAEGEEAQGEAAEESAAPPSRRPRSSFQQRMEERFRRRMDGDR